MHPVVGALIAYASGSIPAAYLAGRIAGVDLRTKGSGNLGATNVVRVLGIRVGLAVFAVDLLKGALPVALLPAITSGTLAPTWLMIMYGAAAIAGHVRPAWLGFAKGGKGVATACGVFLALTLVPTLFALAAFLVTLGATGYVSLGSLVAAVALPVLVASAYGVASVLFGVSVIIGIFVFWTHRANIGRLHRGDESRFSRMGALGAPVGVILAALVTAAGTAWLLWGGHR